MKRCLLLCLLVIPALMGCVGFPKPTEAPAAAVYADIPAPAAEAPTEPMTEAAAQPEGTEPPDYVTTLLREMTLRQKVGQLFIIHPDSLDPPPEPEKKCAVACTPAMKEAMAEYPVGGIIMFGENIESPGQLKEFNENLQACAQIPLFICVDEEGGLVSRLANHKAFRLPKYRSAAAIGKSETTANALEMGRTIGAYLKEYGFNVDFAPVADINTNPKNTIIGNRAFSSTPEAAGQMAAAMAEGLRAQGIIPTFKHFPGHGNTAEDSHTALAVSRKTTAELAECELLPFGYATADDMIMVGHIALPAILDSRTPASMSPEIVTGMLKTQMGFQGLVITDSLEMGAVTALYNSAEAALGAHKAGCDLLLMETGHHNPAKVAQELLERGIMPKKLAFIHHGRDILLRRDEQIAALEALVPGRYEILHDAQILEL